jgi:hypothetical protein
MGGFKATGGVLVGASRCISAVCEVGTHIRLTCCDDRTMPTHGSHVALSDCLTACRQMIKI